MDSRNLAIGVLAITAVVLLVGIIVINIQPPPALAGNISSYGGDYTLTVGRVADDTEVLYVLDNVTQRLVIYVINRNSGVVDMLDGFELGQLRAPGSVSRQSTP
jgi:hypothetical protein